MLNRRDFLLGLGCAFLALTLLPAMPAMAQDLDALRASGAVAERYDGYAEVLDPSAAQFVNQVNAKRRDIYNQRATAQGVPAGQVGRVYAKEIFGKAPKGTIFINEDGSKVRKQ